MEIVKIRMAVEHSLHVQRIQLRYIAVRLRLLCRSVRNVNCGCSLSCVRLIGRHPIRSITSVGTCISICAAAFFIALLAVSMYFFSTDKDFFITVISMMVSFRLLQTAGQCPDFLMTGVIMDMFLKFAHQVPVSIITPVLRRVLMLLLLADKFPCD